MLKASFGIILAMTSGLIAAGQGGSMTQTQAGSVTFDKTQQVFRLDGGNMSYAFGVNPRGELQQLYWGGRLGATDKFPQRSSACGSGPRLTTSYTTTPQEYAGWGAGLFSGAGAEGHICRRQPRPGAALREPRGYGATASTLC